jgi:hypothetical protein
LAKQKLKPMKLHVASGVLAGIVFLSSCGGSQEEVVDQVEVVEEAPTEVASDKEINELADFKFHSLIANIPSPLNTYDMLHNSGAPYNLDLCNSIEKRENYLTNSSVATNFGVYMADLGYISCNGDNQKIITTYSVVRSFAEKLGFSAILDGVVKDRLQENVGNKDSSMAILDEAYIAMDEYLKSNDQLLNAGFIVAGSWVESQHIALAMLKDPQVYEANEPLRQEIQQQRLHIANLIKFLEEFKDDADVANLLGGFIAVQSAYNHLVDVEDATPESISRLEGAIALIRHSIVGS